VKALGLGGLLAGGGGAGELGAFGGGGSGSLALLGEQHGTLLRAHIILWG
jgi:hypothetical protein